MATWALREIQSKFMTSKLLVMSARINYCFLFEWAWHGGYSISSESFDVLDAIFKKFNTFFTVNIFCRFFVARIPKAGNFTSIDNKFLKKIFGPLNSCRSYWSQSSFLDQDLQLVFESWKFGENAFLRLKWNDLSLRLILSLSAACW